MNLKTIELLGTRLKLFNPDELKIYLTQDNEDNDFIKFCDEYIEELKSEKKEKIDVNFKTVKNSLVDFFNMENVLVNEINLDMLFRLGKISPNRAENHNT